MCSRTAVNHKTGSLSSVSCCAVPIMAIVTSCNPEMGTVDGSAACKGCLTVPVICLVIAIEGSSVAAIDRLSALFSHVSWIPTSVVNICCTLSFCSFSSLLVVVVPFAFSFVAVSCSFAISLLSFERVSLSNRLLIVLAFFPPL